MLASWPVSVPERDYPDKEADLEAIKEVVRAIRNLRSERTVPPSRKATYYIVSESETVRTRCAALADSYAPLISAAAIHVQADKAGIPGDAVSVVVPNAVVYIPLAELIDVEKERERLQKEHKRLQKELARSNGMLGNEKFLSKAPAAKVAEEREKRTKYQAMLEDVEKSLKELG